MTLQKLTDILQTWCHQGHSQDEVVFETSAGFEKSYGAEVYQFYGTQSSEIVIKTGVLL